ncbi:ribonuclease H-like domain-containing protein [Phakopsora pachyrhizi]|uniref:Ribonuclease H-like domain-containing protein n=1 Tax=Phakopsora pachyrhizi TaxID=170000 RepID=A0AAV0BLC8_PHAPC|nr:ribonuclease H-like domain-containing protein [Phakopsora pachyrhizi]CAH7687438.1 ribonuclease H-like domain-containing protein [Phakopsora pachyrhizi]
MSHQRIRFEVRDDSNRSRAVSYKIDCFDKPIFVLVTSKPAVAREWIGYVTRQNWRFVNSGRLIVGVGVQWTPGSDPSAAVLAICVGKNCLIFQIHRAGRIPRLVYRFLSDERHRFVGINNFSDQRMLLRFDSQLLVRELIELGRLARDRYQNIPPKVSMETLAHKLLGWPNIMKNENVGRSDWEVTNLSHAQIKYAALDAFLSFRIAEVVLKAR